jgi:hypothetical protein
MSADFLFASPLLVLPDSLPYPIVSIFGFNAQNESTVKAELVGLTP